MKKRIMLMALSAVLILSMFSGCRRKVVVEESYYTESDSVTSGEINVDSNNSQDESNVSNMTSGSSKPAGNTEGGVQVDNKTGVAYLDDELDDWSKVYKHGVDLEFDGYAPAMFGGDNSRIKRWNDWKDCWIQWKFEAGIKEFGLVIYGHKDYEELTVSVSKDGKNWTEIPLTKPNVVTITKEEWVRRTYRWFDIDPANKYVMIDIGDIREGRNVYFPNVSRIRINNVAKMDDPDRMLEGRKAATFYVDSKNGSDNNSGLSPDKAYKSLSKISKRYFQPGDKILFKSGLSFNGALKIRGKGSKENPITVGTYGGSKKAKIAARGDSAVFAQSANIIIENLEVTNPNGSKGIEVVTITTGENPNYTIRNCNIHDINLKQDRFEPSKYDTGAILVACDGLDPTWINGLTIENNTITNVSKVGIIVGTEWAYRPGVWGKSGYYNAANDTGRWPNKNVVIRGNVITKAYGDSILSCMNDGAIIEKNTSIDGFYNSKVKNIACAGIWTIGSNDTKIQYNEVSFHHKNPGTNDGEAFDIDISEKRTHVQYNYTHDNYGGFLLMCNDYGGPAGKISCDAVVRFNLSVNDGTSVKTVWQLDDLNNGAMIYNNTTYFGSWITKPFSHWQAASENFTFVNNIFVGQAGVKYDWSSMKNGGGWPKSVFKNNVCYNVGYQDLVNSGSGMTFTGNITDKDPKFKNPSIDTKKATREQAIAAFTPTVKIGGAVNVPNNGGKDIAGNKFGNIDFYGCVKH